MCLTKARALSALFVIISMIGSFYLPTSSTAELSFHSAQKFPSIEIRLEEPKLRSIEDFVGKHIESGILDNNDREWHKAILIAGSTVFKIKLAPRGLEIGQKHRAHWRDAKTPSFSVKMRGKKYFASKRKFNLQPLATKPLNFVTQSVANELGLVTPDYSIVQLKLNGVNLGLYYLEEALTSLTLESNKRPSGPIIGFDEFDEIRAQMSRSNGILDTYHSNVGFKDVSTKITDNPFYELKTSPALFALHSAQSRTSHPSKLFDYAEFAKAFAFINLFGGAHSQHLLNIKFYYNPIISKLAPIIIDEDLETISDSAQPAHVPIKLPFPYKQMIYCEPFTDRVTEELNRITTPQMLSNLSQIISKKAAPILAHNAENNENLTAIEVERLISLKLKERSEKIRNFIAEVMEQKFECGSTLDPSTLSSIEPYQPFAFPGGDLSYDHTKLLDPEIIQHFSSYIIDQAKKSGLDLVRKSHATLAEIDPTLGKATFHIRSLVKSPLKVEELIIDRRVWPINKTLSVAPMKEGKNYLQMKSQSVVFEVIDKQTFSWASISPKNISVKISIAGKSYLEPVYFQGYVSDLNDAVFVDQSEGTPTNVEFIEGINRKENTWVIGPGTIDIHKTIVFGSNRSVNILPNTTINLFSGSKLITSGPANLNGSEKLGRIIVNIFPKIIDGVPVSFGGLVFTGDSPEKTNIVITGTQLTGQGNITYSPTPDRSDFLGSKGCVTFYRLNAEVKDLVVDQMHCEDAINIVNTTFVGENISINRSKMDALDADFSNLKLTNSIFNKNGNDSIDVSFSEAKVGNISINSSGDKGISIGESSSVEGQNISVSGSKAGLVVKDGSSAFIEGFVSNKNDIGIALYKKKRYFTAPRIDCEKCRFFSSAQHDYLIGKNSLATVNKYEIIGRRSKTDFVNAGLVQ